MLHLKGAAERHADVPCKLMMQTCNMQGLVTTDKTKACITSHALQSRPWWHAEKFYLGLHELRVALIDVHLLELVLSVVRVQQAAGLQHLDLVL